MKKILSLTSALLFAGAAGILLAQNDTSTPAAATAPSAEATPMSPMGKGNHPMIKELHGRFEEQNMRIKAGVKNKKLTKDEAKALHAKVKSIREEMQSDIKANGDGKLTSDQSKQLNQELDDNSTAIHDQKAEGSTDSGASATPDASTSPAAN